MDLIERLIDEADGYGDGPVVVHDIEGLRALLTEAADALEAAREAAWQPIETAPMDGSYILLTDTRHAPCHLIARWKHGAWWGQLTLSGRSIVWRDATHWMPLPSPPEAAGGAA